MPVYGQFETVRVLSHGAVATAETARRIDGTGGEDYVVKASRPLPFAGDAQTQRQLADFADQAQVQRAAASAGAHWATVHESGTSDDAAFYVTDRFDIHAGQLIQGRVKLTEAALAGILSGVARGLLELHRACGRPHGNLKPTNVLIRRTSGRGGETRAVLGDPLPASRLDAERDAAADRQALGKLLFGLVTHRQHPGVSSWPIEPDQTWLAVGRNAGQWCELCNALLAPETEPALPLEEFIERVEGLRGSGGVPVWRWVAGVGGGVGLLAAAIIWLLAGGGGGPKMTLEEQLARFCDEAEWLDQVRTTFQLAQAPDGDPADSVVTDFDRLRADLVALWAPIEQFHAAVESNPGLGYATFTELEAQRAQDRSEYVPRQLAGTEDVLSQAWDRVDDVRHALANWQPQALVDAAKAFSDAGWTRAAAAVDDLLDQATLPEWLVDIEQWEAGVGSRPEWNTKWAEFNSAWARSREITREDLLASVDAESTHARVTFESVARRAGLTEGEARERSRAVIALADGDLAGPDSLPANLRDLSDAIDRLVNQPAGLDELQAMMPDMGEQYKEEARQGIALMRDDLRSLLEVAAIPVSEYGDQVADWVSRRRDLGNRFREWVVTVEAMITLLIQQVDSPDLREAFLRDDLGARWQGTIDEFNARKSDPDEQESLRRDLPVAAEDVRLHTEALQRISAAASPPTAPLELPPRFEAGRTAFADLVKAQWSSRLRALSRSLSRIESGRDDWSRAEAQIGTQRAALTDWIKPRQTLLSDYDRIASHLDQAYGLNEAFSADDADETIAALHAEWGSPYSDMYPIIEPIRDRIAALETVSRTNDLAALTLDASANDPAMAMAVWRRHCELATRPEASTLPDEAALLNTVKQVIENVEPARQTQLMAVAFAPRWLQREGRITADEAAYEALIESRAAYDISDAAADPNDPSRSSRIAFNIALWEFKRTIQPMLASTDDHEEELRAQLAAFVAEWQPRLPGERDSTLPDFRNLLNDVQTGPSPAEIGPAGAAAAGPWVYDEGFATGTDVLSYIWTRPNEAPHRLTFRNVGANADGLATYLSVDEVSVGLFRDIMKAGADVTFWEGQAGALPRVTNFQGARDLVTWTWENGAAQRERMQANPGYWIENPPPDFYPSGTTPAPPTTQHPVQRISPAAAIYMARLANCRLPTHQEWADAARPVADIIDAALASERDWNDRVAGSTALDQSLANLRDEAWRIQRDHLQDMRNTVDPSSPAYDSYQLAEAADLQGDETVTWNDGALWLRETSQADGRFRNLIGNVGEFVWRDGVPMLDGSSNSFDAVRRAVRRDALEVIGGSALSTGSAARGEAAAELGDSDVGFRLAFEAGPIAVGFSAGLKKSIEPTPFVYASSSAGDL